MGAAKPLVLVEPQPLAWTEICARYPDQYVCLIDIERVESGSSEIATARVVGCGPTRDAAFDPARARGAPYPRHAVRFTGVCTEPLIRPSLVIDDETLKILQA